MGRNKKDYKHWQIKKLPRINLKQYVCPLCICISFYILLLVVCGIFRLGSAWESWKNESDYIPLIFTLSIFRVFEYTIPAIVIKNFLKKDWKVAFNYQFACYAVMNAFVFLTSLDYALDIELFSSS